MDRSSVIERLRQHEAELKAAGVLHLRLFGSVARGEQTERSDVDLMADIEPTKRRTLIMLSRLQNRLSDLLGAQVDLSISNSVREPVKSSALREAILAF